MTRSTMLKSLFVGAMVFAAGLVAHAEPVKGNPDSKIYHKAECRHYNGKGSTKAFASETEAKEAGYMGCKQCATPKAEKKDEKKQDTKTK